MNLNNNFSSPFFSYGSNFSTGASNTQYAPGHSSTSSNNNYSSSYNYPPSFDTTNFNTLHTGCTKTSTASQDQTNSGTSVTNTDAMQMMMTMISMMMQMMQNVMQNAGVTSGSGTSSSSGSSSSGSSSGISNLDTASDSDITTTQSSIASELATPGSSTDTNNQDLVSQIATLDPNSADSATAQVALINSNSSANPQNLQSFALLQALRGQNETLDSISNKTGYSTTRSQTTAARNSTMSALQTLQTRPLSTEELTALPINSQVKQALLPNTLTASQILDLNAYNDRDASYTPPGGVYINTTQPTTLTPLQSQYLFYQGQQVA